MNITEIRHPDYIANSGNWEKWRLTYEGGWRFIDECLTRFSTRESVVDFEARKKITYNPAFAQAAIDEVRNAIYSRFDDIDRKGSNSYDKAMKGQLNGVDLKGTNMNAFIGCTVLPELITMSRVGVFVDMPSIVATTLAAQQPHPYLYIYRIEDIRSWAYDKDNPTVLKTLLMREKIREFDESTELPKGDITLYRLLRLVDDHVEVTFYDEQNQQTLKNGSKGTETYILDIPVIPFVMLDIGVSLIKDTCLYQIALLNMSSTDLAYSLRANFPFYVEQFDPRMETLLANLAGEGDDGTAKTANISKPLEIKTGVSAGRRYPANLNQPAFIHPSAEPLRVSMEKQEQLKTEIRLLTHLAISNMRPAAIASAESKQMDDAGLQAGLNFIALVLENAENAIARIWSMYEGSDEGHVVYPRGFKLVEIDQWKIVESLKSILANVPSTTFRKSVLNRIVTLVLGARVSSDVLAKIKSEIEKSVILITDPDTVAKHVEIGIVSRETASTALGYPDGEIEIANEEHADRAARIAIAQSKVAERGVDDKDTDPTGTKKNDVASDIKDNLATKLRGEGK